MGGVLNFLISQIFNIMIVVIDYLHDIRAPISHDFTLFTSTVNHQIKIIY